MPQSHYCCFGFPNSGGSFRARWDFVCTAVFLQIYIYLIHRYTYISNVPQLLRQLQGSVKGWFTCASQGELFSGFVCSSLVQSRRARLLVCLYSVAVLLWIHYSDTDWKYCVQGLRDLLHLSFWTCVDACLSVYITWWFYIYNVTEPIIGFFLSFFLSF